MKVIEKFDIKGRGLGIVVDCREPIEVGNWITDGKSIWKINNIEVAWILSGEVKEKSLFISGSDEPRIGAIITRIFERTLYRPVGYEELKLIEDSGFVKFPERLPGQPYFYPVCNYEYACDITKKWNTKLGKGFVVSFDIRNEFLENYITHVVGSKLHEEYWIPAEELEKLNDAILGKIEVISEFDAII